MKKEIEFWVCPHCGTSAISADCLCAGQTLEELAQEQNVKPMADIRALFGTWPGEVDDGFEDAIIENRTERTGFCLGFSPTLGVVTILLPVMIFLVALVFASDDGSGHDHKMPR